MNLKVEKNHQIMTMNNPYNMRNYLSRRIALFCLLTCPGLGIPVQVGNEAELNVPWKFRTHAAYLFVLAE